MTNHQFKIKTTIAGEDLRLTVRDSNSTTEEAHANFHQKLSNPLQTYFENFVNDNRQNKETGGINYFTLGGKFLPEIIDPDEETRSDLSTSIDKSKTENAASDGNYSKKMENLTENLNSDSKFKFEDPETAAKKYAFQGCINSLVLAGYEFDLHGHERRDRNQCVCYNCYKW